MSALRFWVGTHPGQTVSCWIHDVTEFGSRGDAVQYFDTKKPFTMMSIVSKPSATAPWMVVAMGRQSLQRYTRQVTATSYRWFSSNSAQDESDSVVKRIEQHSRQPQTPVSLKALLQTGRGEFLRMEDEDDESKKSATDKILMQVCLFRRGKKPTECWMNMSHSLFVVVYPCCVGF